MASRRSILQNNEKFEDYDNEPDFNDTIIKREGLLNESQNKRKQISIHTNDNDLENQGLHRRSSQETGLGDSLNRESTRANLLGN